jgi:hypothetical protein
MSNTGAVIIANNTDNFDYIKLAEVAATKIKINLGIPVALITGSDIESDIFDKIIQLDPKETNKRYIREYAGHVSWLNMDRTAVYDLTPWDRTLLIDADFFVHTDALKNHLLSTADFAIARKLYDPTTGNDYVLKLGKSQIDQRWATVMIFNKSTVAKSIFEMAKHVFDHWYYYHKLYNFNFAPYRNDYAFTIACHLLGGYGTTDFDISNYTMPNCDFNTRINQLNMENILISYDKIVNTQPKTFVQRIKTDVHVQNKASLFGCLS